MLLLLNANTGLFHDDVIDSHGFTYLVGKRTNFQIDFSWRVNYNLLQFLYFIEVGKITDLPQVKGNLNHAQIIMYENQTHRSGENHWLATS